MIKKELLRALLVAIAVQPVLLFVFVKEVTAVIR